MYSLLYGINKIASLLNYTQSEMVLLISVVNGAENSTNTITQYRVIKQ
jgi:hypothetical protein